VLGSVPAPSLRPRLATTHSFLFGGGFLFFDLVWWWRARSDFSFGEMQFGRGKAETIFAGGKGFALPRHFVSAAQEGEKRISFRFARPERDGARRGRGIFQQENIRDREECATDFWWGLMKKENLAVHPEISEMKLRG